MNKTLAIYLNDHLALMTSEVELAERVYGENKENELGLYLRQYAEQVASQQSHLAELLTTVGGTESVLKQTAGWLAEKVGRLKLNGSLLRYNDLSRVIELEGLLAAATTRVALWETLELLQTSQQIPATHQCGASLEESKTQRSMLEKHHRHAVQTAFIHSASPKSAAAEKR